MKKMNDLPSDIIIDILSRIPVDLVLQCKRVCKTWRSLVDHDPTFLALHTHRFITSSSSSSSSGGQLQVIKSAAAAFSFFVMVSRYRLYGIDNDELYFGEYPYYYNVSTPLMKLSNKSIPISSNRFHRLLIVDNSKCITSCNGLILIASISHNNNNNNSDDDDDDADMFVFNPVTREYVHLPRPPPPFDKYHHDDDYDDDGGRVGGIGFGYHPITNEYKIVRITSSSSSFESDCISSVYTLGSGVWRKSKGETKTNINLGGGGGGGGNNNNNNNNNIYHLRWSAHPAVLLNGVLHWLRNQCGYGVILSFDLADEELNIFPLPPQEEDPFLWEPDRINHLHLGVLGGCLCLSANNVQNQSRVDIWVLNKLEFEDHNQEYYSTTATAAASCSWTRKYSFFTGAAAAGEYEIVADLGGGGGGKILFSRFHDGWRLGLVSYDPKTGYVEDLNEKRCFGIGRYWNRWSAMIPYMKSFVSLKALGERIISSC